MGVPIEGGSLEIRRRVSIRTKPGMRLPLQVQVGMKRPVVQEKGFDLKPGDWHKAFCGGL